MISQIIFDIAHRYFGWPPIRVPVDIDAGPDKAHWFIPQTAMKFLETGAVVQVSPTVSIKVRCEEA